MYVQLDKQSRFVDEFINIDANTSGSLFNLQTNLDNQRCAGTHQANIASHRCTINSLKFATANVILASHFINTNFKVK